MFSSSRMEVSSGRDWFTAQNIDEDLRYRLMCVVCRPTLRSKIREQGAPVRDFSAPHIGKVKPSYSRKADAYRKLNAIVESKKRAWLHRSEWISLYSCRFSIFVFISVLVTRFRALGNPVVASVPSSS
jgi:hypothetical protein